MGLNYALKQESKLKSNIFKQKKLILILDLDNTLVHATNYKGFVKRPDYYGKFDPVRNIY